MDRYGYRRITALLRNEGWKVNHKRVERIWRKEGLKIPKKQPKRGRLWLTAGACIRLRPESSLDSPLMLGKGEAALAPDCESKRDYFPQTGCGVRKTKITARRGGDCF